MFLITDSTNMKIITTIDSDLANDREKVALHGQARPDRQIHPA